MLPRFVSAPRKRIKRIGSPGAQVRSRSQETPGGHVATPSSPSRDPIGCPKGRGSRADYAGPFPVGSRGSASPEADGGGGGGASGRPGLQLRPPHSRFPAARGVDKDMQSPPPDPLGDCLRNWEDLQQDFQGIQVSVPAAIRAPSHVSLSRGQGSGSPRSDIG